MCGRWSAVAITGTRTMTSPGSTSRPAGSPVARPGRRSSRSRSSRPSNTGSRAQPLNGSTAHPAPGWHVLDPHNAEGSGYGTISLESATVNSVNVAYANLLSVIGDGDPYAGAAALVEAATRMGIQAHHRAQRPAGGGARRRPG